MHAYFFTICLVILLSLPSIAETAVSKRNNKSFKNKKDKNSRVIRSEAGLKIPDWGIAIDATFNPQLDSIIPDYHILNIVLTNQRGQPISLKAKDDKWIIVDSMGKRHTAYNHITQFDKELWNKLPRKLQLLLDYPHAVSSGKSTKIDVFLPKSVDLFNFREIIWKSSHFNKEFNVFTTYEKDLSIPNLKEFDTPKTNTVSEQEILQKIKEHEQKDNFHEDVVSPSTTNPQPTEITTSNTNNTSTRPSPTLDGFIRIK